MDNRILVVFGTFVAMFLALPFAAQFMGSGTTDQTSNAEAATEIVIPQIPKEPPLWNSHNIVGTEWKLRWETYDLKASIAPNGVCYISHPFMRSLAGTDRVEGSWRIEYDHAYFEVVFGTNHHNFVLTIVGSEIYDPDGVRLERY